MCSYAFALPVATAPNAIVFGHSSMRTTDMMKVCPSICPFIHSSIHPTSLLSIFSIQAGFLMNLVCVVTVAISINTYAVPLFDLNRSEKRAPQVFVNVFFFYFNYNFQGNSLLRIIV